MAILPETLFLNAQFQQVPMSQASLQNFSIQGLFYESATDGITANAGGGQANAVLLTTETNRVTTVATAGDSVRLPPALPGLTIFLINHGANTMTVFGNGSDMIDDVTIGVPQMINSEVIYTCTTSGRWYSNGLGTGYSGAIPTVSFLNGITAHAGGGQGSATLLANVINRVTTVATAGDSVALMPSTGGMQITVVNAGAQSLNVFPATGEQINSLGANAAFAIAAGKTTTFFCALATQWHALASA